MKSRNAKIGVALALVLMLIGGVITVRSASGGRTHITGYFADSIGLYNGDDVVILGVPVGRIERSNRTPTGSRFSSGTTTNTRCPPTPRL